METIRTPIRSVVLPDLVTVQDLAPFFQVTRETLRRWLRRGVLPGRKIGRCWIIERKALLRAVAPDGAEEHRPFTVVAPGGGDD